MTTTKTTIKKTDLSSPLRSELTDLRNDINALQVTVDKIVNYFTIHGWTI